jgi:hypothetical protein
LKAQLVNQVENLLVKQAVAPGFAQTLSEIPERAETAREIFEGCANKSSLKSAR